MGEQQREHGMEWKEIQKYDRIIEAIAAKYSGNIELQRDVAQEVRLLLRSDKNLDTSKFDPNKKDAAIRNTIRNKTIKVLKSKKIGRFPFDSLDWLCSVGLQVDTEGNIFVPSSPDVVPHEQEDDWIYG